MQLQDHREQDTVTVSVKLRVIEEAGLQRRTTIQKRWAKRLQGSLTEIWIPVLSACISIPVTGYPKN